MEKDVRISRVDAYQTKAGNTQFVVRDEEGNTYATFREDVAGKAMAAERLPVRIEYHERQRGGFTNVYLDRVEPLEGEEPEGDGDTDAAAWEVAAEALPWLIGTSKPD